ncbi:hypothetical protein A8146_22530 [Mesorhizobium loti]|nr:hypothetical protein A8146_22530 [Mesorhizobium loti]
MRSLQRLVTIAASTNSYISDAAVDKFADVLTNVNVHILKITGAGAGAALTLRSMKVQDRHSGRAVFARAALFPKMEIIRQAGR